MPAALASSTAYWISGLATTVSISFGIALVAGRVRVPSHATGNTALRTRICIELLDPRLAGALFPQALRKGKQPAPPVASNGSPAPIVHPPHRREGPLV